MSKRSKPRKPPEETGAEQTFPPMTTGDTSDENEETADFLPEDEGPRSDSPRVEYQDTRTDHSARIRDLVSQIRSIRAAASSAPHTIEPQLDALDAISDELEG